MSETQDSTKRTVKKPALGRGLGSLLGEAAGREIDLRPRMPSRTEGTATPGFQEQVSKTLKEGFIEPASPIPEHGRIWQIDIAKLRANKKQPRQVFHAEALKELSQSIKQKGVLQPIVARKLADGEFEIIAGERRWRAAQMAGLKEIPVILKETVEQEALELALIENIQRENLNPIEEAEAYNHLIKTYALTQQQLADKLGKDRATVANTLRLLALDKAAREHLINGRISMGHAKVLLAITDQAQQKALADRVAAKKVSVRELEREVAKILTPKSATTVGLDVDVSQKFMAGLSEELQKIIGTRVTIDYHRGKGSISIRFFSDAELNGIVERLREAWRK